MSPIHDAPPSKVRKTGRLRLSLSAITYARKIFETSFLL